MFASFLRRRAGNLGLAALAGLFALSTVALAQDQINLHGDQIPKQVLDALRARFPRAEIDKCTREKEGSRTVYDIEFRQAGRKFEADINENGTIHNWEKAIAAKNLPEAVRKAIEKKYPRSSVREVMEITGVKDGNETREGYEVVLKVGDKKPIEITVAPNGKILEAPGDKK